jgi:hypothetical protein
LDLPRIPEQQVPTSLPQHLATVEPPSTPDAIPIFLATGTITVYAKLLKGRKEPEERSLEESELPPLQIPVTSVFYPDKVKAPPHLRGPIPQLKAFLAPKKRSTRTVTRGRISNQRYRKRKTSPTGAEP